MKYLLITLALLPAMLYADDPPAPPPVTLASFAVPKEVTGSGTRADPFVFDASTKCVLRLTTSSPKVEFDLTDAPGNIEVIDRALIFALAEPGLFLAVAHGDGCYAKAWFQINSGTDPPNPKPPTPASLATQLRAALNGPDSKSDAAKLQGMTGALADALEAGKFANYGQMFAAWKASQAATEWPGGKYPKLPDVIRSAIPTATDDVVLDATNKPAILANLRTLEKTAEAIAHGK